MTDLQEVSRNMILGQLLPANVTDTQIIDAMTAIDRRQFAPASEAHNAYHDNIIWLGKERYLLPPKILAQLIDAAEFRQSDKVLDIACADGYSTAVLSQLVAQVYAVESLSDFCSKAHYLLKSLSLENAIVIENPLEIGHPDEGPYDVIFIGVAISELPESLLGQLKEDGYVVFIKRISQHHCHMIRARKNGRQLRYENLGDCFLPKLKETVL